MVTALAALGGCPVGVVANQPRSLAGTLDIAASQKAARFVRFCDTFNLPIVTLVDTPGFLPGKDLEWRGMIRHGAELAFAYAEATVPRLCLVLRKAYGGAYIVMDSKGMGNDLCLAWPSAEIAVMGARGAAQILPGEQATTSAACSRSATRPSSSPPGWRPNGGSWTRSSTPDGPGRCWCGPCAPSPRAASSCRPASTTPAPCDARPGQASPPTGNPEPTRAPLPGPGPAGTGPGPRPSWGRVDPRLGTALEPTRRVVATGGGTL